MTAPQSARPVSPVDRLWQIALWVAYRLLLTGWFIVRPKHHGALVAVWHHGKILIIRNSYRRWLGIPGGSVDRGETALQAAVRELYEETGLRVPAADLSPAGDFPTDFQYQRDTVSIFEISIDTPPVLTQDNREVIAMEFMAPEQALATLLMPPVRDYLLQRASTGQR